MDALLSPYLLLFGLLLLLIYPYQKMSDGNRAKVIWLLLGVFILFFGLRGNVGDDYEHYRSMYEVETLSLIPSMPAFALFMLLLKVVHIPFVGFIFACSCLVNGLLFLSVARLRLNTPFVLCIFLGMSGIANEIDFVRNLISTMLFACSLGYLERGDAKRYFLLNGLGVLFHYAALIYLPFYFLARRQVPKNVFLGMIAIALVFFALRLPFLDGIPRLFDFDHVIATHLYTYINTYTRAMTFTIALVERLLTAFAVYCFYDQLTADVCNRIAVWAFLFFFIACSLFSNYAVLATRLANLFVVCYWILWPAIIRQMQGLRARIATTATVCTYLAVRLVGLASLSQWHYTTVFS